MIDVTKYKDTHWVVVLRSDTVQHERTILLDKNDPETGRNVATLQTLDEHVVVFVKAIPPTDQLVQAWRNEVNRGRTQLGYEEWKKAEGWDSKDSGTDSVTKEAVNTMRTMLITIASMQPEDSIMNECGKRFNQVLNFAKIGLGLNTNTPHDTVQSYFEPAGGADE